MTGAYALVMEWRWGIRAADFHVANVVATRRGIHLPPRAEDAGRAADASRPVRLEWS